METLRSIFIAIGFWTYVLASLDILLESSAFLGVVLPGDTVVILMGILAATNVLAFIPSIVLMICCALCGDTTGYLLGRYKGEQILKKFRFARRQYEENHERVEKWTKRWGGWIIVIGRFMPYIRSVTPFTTGMSNYPFSRFLGFAAMTCALWGGGLFAVGYAFGHNWQALESILAPLGGGVTALIIFGLIGWFLWRHRKGTRTIYRKMISRAAERWERWRRAA
jgi:undecaprenyl-diphosphatase